MFERKQTFSFVHVWPTSQMKPIALVLLCSTSSCISSLKWIRVQRFVTYSLVWFFPMRKFLQQMGQMLVYQRWLTRRKFILDFFDIHDCSLRGTAALHLLKTEQYSNIHAIRGAHKRYRRRDEVSAASDVRKVSCCLRWDVNTQRRVTSSRGQNTVTDMKVSVPPSPRVCGLLINGNHGAHGAALLSWLWMKGGGGWGGSGRDGSSVLFFAADINNGRSETKPRSVRFIQHLFACSHVQSVLLKPRCFCCSNFKIQFINNQ